MNLETGFIKETTLKSKSDVAFWAYKRKKQNLFFGISRSGSFTFLMPSMIISNKLWGTNHTHFSCSSFSRNCQTDI